MKDFIYPFLAVVATLAFVYKTYGLRKNWHDPASRALCYSFAFLALTYVLAIPMFARGFDELVGIPNLAALVIHTSLMAYSGTVHTQLLYWQYSPEIARPRVRRWLLFFVLVETGLVVTFVLADVEKRVSSFILMSAHNPYIAAYTLFMCTGLGTALIATVVSCGRYAKVAGRSWLRRGLRITAVGAVFMLGFTAIRVSDVVGVQLGADPHDWEFLSPLFAAAGVSLISVGLTIPGWGPWLTAIRGWWDTQSAYRRLYPLWLALYQAFPAIALTPPDRGLLDTFTVRDLEFKLYRRVVEIRDGWLSLRPYLSPDVRSGATELAEQAGLTGDELRATVEAAQLRAALRALGDGAEIENATGGGVSRTDTDIRDEIAWLTRVARAFTRSPLVRAAARDED
nr:MAB_1171c family putative transporter [Kibdelosporangium sp. MJ126-NF4]CEL23161.1 putative integral membrane protein [Kibdelosporangium sp. MJ126-NF4]CTQ90299.1 putative integral membrane protein [Kibdelosporangium sp. MJ126-NF4]